MRDLGIRQMVVGLVVGGLVAGCGATALAGTDNDSVLHEDSYHEVFKQEGSGDKNYLYTMTDQPAPKPGHCTVFTGASESAISVVCTPGG